MDVITALQWSVLVVAIAANSFLAIVVFLNNPKSASNKLLSLLSFVTSVWLIVSYLGILPAFFPYGLLLSRLSIFFAVPQVTLFFLLARTLPHDKIQLKKSAFSLLISIGSLILLLDYFTVCLCWSSDAGW